MKFTPYLEKIQGVSIYPILSLAIFVLFFVIVLMWTYRSDSKTIEYIEQLPLEDDEQHVNPLPPSELNDKNQFS